MNYGQLYETTREATVEEHGYGVVCAGCGTVDEEASGLLAELREENKVLKDENARLLVKNKRLTKEQDKRLKNHKRYPEAMKVLEQWKELCFPTAVEVEGQGRLKNVIERLEGGYEVDQLIRSARGYAMKPFLVGGRRTAHGTKDNWRADAELIYRDPSHVDTGIRIVETAEAIQDVIQPTIVYTTPSSSQNGEVPELPAGSLGEAAVRYANAGWRVFPCVHNRKFPATANGLLDATVDLRRIVAYWLKRPHANVAIRTGAESGLIVIDVDSDAGAEVLHDLEQEHGALPRTATIKTPRGGEHYYFRHPDREIRNSASSVGPGIDVRGDGGYVLAPPSMVESRPYEVDEQVSIAEMPLWLVELLLRLQVKGPIEFGPSEWAKLIKMGVREGARNNSLAKVAGHLVRRYAPEEYGTAIDWLKTANQARCDPPLPDHEVETIFRSIVKAEDRREHERATGQAD